MFGVRPAIWWMAEMALPRILVNQPETNTKHQRRARGLWACSATIWQRDRGRERSRRWLRHLADLTEKMLGRLLVSRCASSSNFRVTGAVNVDFWLSMPATEWRLSSVVFSVKANMATQLRQLVVCTTYVKYEISQPCILHYISHAAHYTLTSSVPKCTYIIFSLLSKYDPTY